MELLATGKGFASADRLHLRSWDVLIAQRMRNRIRSTLGQKLVELLGPRTVGEPFDAHPGLGTTDEKPRQSLDGELGARLQSRLTRVEEDIFHGDDQAPIRLLGLQVRELPLRLAQLGFGSLRFLLARGEQGLLALALSLGDLLVGLGFSHPRLARLGIAQRDIGETVDVLDGLFLLLRGLGLLQGVAGRLQVRPRGLLGERIRRERTYFGARVIEHRAVRGCSGTGRQKQNSRAHRGQAK